MSALLVTAVTLGLAAGLTPGPLLTLVLAETLKYGVREGMKVVVAPMLTEVPLVAGSAWLIGRLAVNDVVFGVISLLGAAAVAYIGWENLRVRHVAFDLSEAVPRSFRKGLIVGLLNPYAYLFWLTIGGPLMVQGAEADGPMAAVGFATAFFATMLGAKAVIAWGVARSRGRLPDRVYVYTLRGLGAALLIFAALLARDGIGRLL